MKKFFLILLIAIIASSYGLRSAQDEDDISFRTKIQQFLQYVKTVPKYQRIYENIYDKDKRIHPNWNALVDDLTYMVAYSEDKGIGELDEYSQTFCVNRMKYKAECTIGICKDFIEAFHIYLK